jgi:hypothetical protein
VLQWARFHLQSAGQRNILRISPQMPWRPWRCFINRSQQYQLEGAVEADIAASTSMRNCNGRLQYSCHGCDFGARDPETFASIDCSWIRILPPKLSWLSWNQQWCGRARRFEQVVTAFWSADLPKYMHREENDGSWPWEMVDANTVSFSFCAGWPQSQFSACSLHAAWKALVTLPHNVWCRVPKWRLS